MKCNGQDFHPGAQEISSNGKKFQFHLELRGLDTRSFSIFCVISHRRANETTDHLNAMALLRISEIKNRDRQDTQDRSSPYHMSRHLNY